MSYGCSKPVRVYFCAQKSAQKGTGGPWAIGGRRVISGLEENVARYLKYAAPVASLNDSGSHERLCGGYSLSWGDGPSGNGAPSVHALCCCCLTSCLD